MRDSKFSIKDNPVENDDIQYAFDYNGLGARLKDIETIVAEVAGENDGYRWYWILKMKDGTFSWAMGSCDYTGWDCQSDAEIYDGYKNAEDAIAAVEVGTDSRTKIKECLYGQVKGDIPFAIYQES